jgi:integrase
MQIKLYPKLYPDCFYSIYLDRVIPHYFMANYYFRLRAPESTTATPIVLHATYQGGRVKCKTNLSILPSQWNTEDQYPNKTKELKRLRDRLDFLKTCADKAYTYYSEVMNKQPDSTEFQTKFYMLSGLAKETKSLVIGDVTVNLLSFISKVIEEAKTRFNSQTGKQISGNTIKVYKQCERLLTEFNKEKRKIDFQDIDLDFFHDFKEFLLKKQYSQNTIAKHFITLKSFLNEATERGVNTSLAYKSKRFRAPQELVDTIYLNEAEITEIYKLDLSKERKLDRVRDLFLVGCYTGLRFSDFTAIKPENIKGGFFEITAQKTNGTVIIPIHPHLVQIMSKYKGKYSNSLPPAISNQKMNGYLKDIGEKVDSLKTQIQVKQSKGVLKVESTESKFNKITTHTARRSFATNLYLEGIPTISIMKITGHRTEKAFLRYIRITPNDNAKVIQLHWQKKHGLKVS